MKYIVLCLWVLSAALSLSTVQAATVEECAWYMQGTGNNKLFVEASLPSSIELRKAPVGSVMASSQPIIINLNGSRGFVCNPGMRYISMLMEQGSLVEGFTDVFHTGVAGVGFRLIDLNGSRAIPFQKSYEGAGGVVDALNKVRIDYVRISRDIATGQALMNFKVQQILNGWDALEVKFFGSTRIYSQAYFSGCTGVEKINISMGRVPISNLGSKQKPFNLDVLCSGMAAGTKVPVKVYFDGSSEGPGRLSLEPGGAKGVELSLLSDQGIKLPFSLGGALGMTWVRSEPTGEIYRLPVVAEYVKKDSQAFEPGMANATLNYILEYN
ncbi:hypothetical protein D3C81_736030 [compost metagenome]